METIRGIVQRLIYKNESNAYCVFLLEDYNEEQIVCTANLEAPKEGDDLELTGRYITHKKYGRQFETTTIERLKPDTLYGAKQYLINLGVRGLGEKSIDKIMDYFGEELIAILRAEDPVELLEVPSLRKSVKEDLYNSLRGEGLLQEINRFLEGAGLSSRWSRILYTTYGGAAINVLEDNPFRLMDIDSTITFSMADTLRTALEIEPNDERRIEAAVLYTLRNISDNGHSCMPADELIGLVFDMLGGYAEEIAARLEELLDYGQIIGTDHEGLLYIYSPNIYHAESEAAYLTQRLLAEGAVISLDLANFVEQFEGSKHIRLGEAQKEAIQLALQNKMALITGGPGTGKTTIIQALVEAFQQTPQNRILLCAPTGRAAKRLTEATGYEATTIHRLLMPIQGSDSYDFTKNEDNLLEADVVIVDEASMLNVQLYYSLLAAIPETAYVIIVGDVDQLPPIGAGFVLRDLLDSEIIPFVRLNTIFRQKEGNRIVTNAHDINHGLMPELGNSGEFTFIEVRSVTDMMHRIVASYKEALATAEDELEVQVISPMRRGVAGSVAISKTIQEAINKKSTLRSEVKINGQIYRVGDKVIQVLNNYELEVFNGEIGVIFAISKTDVSIRFLDKEVKVPMEDMVSFMLAYAITVHKSQGSEYSTVIIPFIPTYHQMLQRNLLYTAVTRARNKVIVIGTKGAIQRAVGTQSGLTRYSLFKERLQGVM
ncbi:ATP-dependent RecD-like DNA helicase [Veillonella sp. R32]|uniref:SF1B family DNA helicase RecD2 n=1 Tax=Veillonella sp. R32 TaxID=2021312 RepID=UPI0013895026|nr:ATP-dependent RecD-like DNA helicase [Veillonella sp. R32]KAF1682988.1 ATP-dependent RecD-like DNA helicase [Veillonella sp. R32]